MLLSQVCIGGRRNRPGTSAHSPVYGKDPAPSVHRVTAFSSRPAALRGRSRKSAADPFVSAPDSMIPDSRPLQNSAFRRASGRTHCCAPSPYGRCRSPVPRPPFPALFFRSAATFRPLRPPHRPRRDGYPHVPLPAPTRMHAPHMPSSGPCPPLPCGRSPRVRRSPSFQGRKLSQLSAPSPSAERIFSSYCFFLNISHFLPYGIRSLPRLFSTLTSLLKILFLQRALHDKAVHKYHIIFTYFSI